MAEHITIAIMSEDYARAWLDGIILLNEEYDEIVRDAGTSLIEMRTLADGILIDQIAELGNKDVIAGKQIKEAMSSVKNDVLNTIEKTDSFSEEIVDLFKWSRKVLG